MTIASPKKKKGKKRGKATSMPKGASLDKYQEAWLRNNYGGVTAPKLSLTANLSEQVI